MSSLVCLSLILLALSGCHQEKPLPKNPLPIIGESFYTPTPFNGKKTSKEPTNTPLTTDKPDETNTTDKEEGTKVNPFLEKAESLIAEKEPPKQKRTFKTIDFEKTLAYEGENYLQLSFEHLTGIPPEQMGLVHAPSDITEESLSAEIKALHGKKIVIEGYMLPVHFEEGKTNKFLLVCYQLGCCFGRMPQLTEQILVTMQNPEGIDSLPSYALCEVYGTLEVGQKEDTQKTLFRIQGVHVGFASSLTK